MATYTNPGIDFADLGRALRRAHCTDYLPWDPVELEDRFRWLEAFCNTLVPEYRLKNPRMLWWQDPAFLRFLKKYPDHDRGMNNDRKWNLIQMLRLCQAIPGDTAECGVFKGASSWIILNCWQQSFAAGERTHYIFDSFEGLSSPDDAVDGTHWKKNDMCAGEDEVRQTLHEFAPFFQTLRGWIPEKFPEVQEHRFAFVHIDVDIYQPTRDSIEFFYPRLNDGGILICDDYGSTTCPGATKAVDEFLADKPEKMLAFASAGGWIMKGKAVAEPYFHDAREDRAS